MWGNALGWFISAVIVLATVGGIALLQHRIGATTPATSLVLSPILRAALAVPTPPQSLRGDMTASSDAGAVYRRATDTVLADRSTYAEFVRTGTSAGAPRLTALADLLEAAALPAGGIFESDPARIINYDRANPSIEALDLLSRCAIRVALLETNSDPARAANYARAVLALGEAMATERLTLAQLRLGISLMDQATRIICAAAPSLASEAQAFSMALREYSDQHVSPVAQAIVTIDPGLIAQHSGDVFYLARHASERMWRVEAILALGRLRYNSALVGDSRAAQRLLERLARDPDPVIQAAARSALALAPQDYRMQG